MKRTRHYHEGQVSTKQQGLVFILSVPEVSPVSEMLSDFIVNGLFCFVCCFLLSLSILP